VVNRSQAPLNPYKEVVNGQIIAKCLLMAAAELSGPPRYVLPHQK
jgi:hypothetical protein